MWRIRRMLVVLVLLSGVLTGTAVYGQGGATGAISGLVVDTSGGAIASAEVQIIDSRTESVVRTLPSGV